MPKKIPTARRAMGIAIAMALTFSVPTGANAQLAKKRALQREQQQEQKDGSATAPAEEKFPQATRRPSETKATAKIAPKLQKLSKAYEEGDAAEALSIADGIIADGKANAYEKAFSARLAGATLINDDNLRALEYLQRSLSLDGLNNNDHYQTMLIVAQIQLQEGQEQQGLATIEKMLAETGSNDPSHLAVKGTALYRLERYAEAITVLKAAIQQSPEPQAAWSQMLMASYAETGRTAEAAGLAEQLAARTPGDKRAQLNLAATYMQMEQTDKAAAVLEKLRNAGELTDERDYRNLYALYLNSDGREKEAISAINEGLQKGALKPDHQTYSALAQAYYFSGQPEAAIDAYRKAAPLASNGETYLNLAKVLANEGRAAESRQAAQQALDKGVKNPEDARKLLAR